MTYEKNLIGKWVEVVVDGRLIVGTVYNVFRNGNVWVRPVYSRDGNQLFLLYGKQRLASVKWKRCELRDHPLLP